MTDQQSAVLAPRGDAPSGRPETESPARKWTQSLSLGRGLPSGCQDGGLLVGHDVSMLVC